MTRRRRDAARRCGRVATLVLFAACASSDTTTRDLIEAFPTAHVRSNGGDRGPRVESDPPTLHIPGGSGVSFDLRVGPGARLELGDLASIGTGAGRLTVWIAADGKGEAILRELKAPGRGGEIDLPRRWRGIVRVSFDADHSAGGVVRLSSLRVRDARPAQPEASRPAGRRPNVIVYLVDTLRADSLGCYGAASGASPSIDALAADGIVYRRALAESSWTRSSVASLFTGLPVHVHGVAGRPDGLAAEAVTMAEMFRDGGWTTAGFITNGNIAALYGFAQGFDVFELLPGTRVPAPDGSHLGAREAAREPLSPDLNDRVLRWLDARADTGPFFLYLHSADPHSPYDPAPEFRSRFGIPVESVSLGSLDSLDRLRRGLVPRTPEVLRTLRALYDAEVAFNDHHIGLLVAALRERGLYDDTVIVVLSDHGEEFFEHGSLEHGQTLYREVTHVPLIVKLPLGDGVRGERVDRIVQLADVLPTLTRYAELPGDGAPTGTSLLAALDAVRPAAPRVAYARIDLDASLADGLVDGRWTLIRTREHLELYDHRHDAEQRIDVSAAHPVTTAYLASKLAADVAATRPRWVVPAAQLTDEVRRNLQALGYVE